MIQSEQWLNLPINYNTDPYCWGTSTNFPIIFTWGQHSSQINSFEQMLKTLQLDQLYGVYIIFEQQPKFFPIIIDSPYDLNSKRLINPIHQSKIDQIFNSIDQKIKITDQIFNSSSNHQSPSWILIDSPQQITSFPAYVVSCLRLDQINSIDDHINISIAYLLS